MRSRTTTATQRSTFTMGSGIVWRTRRHGRTRISVSAEGRTDNPLLSSVNISIGGFGLKVGVNVGMENIGFSASTKSNDITTATTVKLNLNELTIGVEISETVKIDDTASTTTYHNVSVDPGVPIAALIYIAVQASNVSRGIAPAPIPIFDYVR